MGCRRSRVEVDARRLAHAHAADLPLGHERPQVHLGQVHERDDRRARHHHLARLGRARGHRARERRDHLEVLAVGARLVELRAGALGVGLGGGDVRLAPAGSAPAPRPSARREWPGSSDSPSPPSASRAPPRPGAAPPRPPPPGPPRCVCARCASCSATSSLLEEARDRLPVPPRLRVRGLGLGQLRLGRRQPPSASLTRPCASTLRLVHPELVLPELLVEHGDLVLGEPHARLGLPHRGRRPAARARGSARRRAGRAPGPPRRDRPRAR